MEGRSRVGIGGRTSSRLTEEDVSKTYIPQNPRKGPSADNFFPFPCSFSFSTFPERTHSMEDRQAHPHYSASAAGSIIGPLLSNSLDAARYVPGVKAVLVIFSVLIGIIGLQVVFLFLFNKQRQRQRVTNGKPKFIHDTSMETKSIRRMDRMSTMRRLVRMVSFLPPRVSGVS